MISKINKSSNGVHIESLLQLAVQTQHDIARTTQQALLLLYCAKFKQAKTKQKAAIKTKNKKKKA